MFELQNQLAKLNAKLDNAESAKVIIIDIHLLLITSREWVNYRGNKTKSIMN